MVMHTTSAPDTDDVASMTMSERLSWVCAFAFPIALAGYFVAVLPQLASTPVGEIGWQVPVLIAIGSAIVVAIVATIISAIVGGIITREAPAGDDIRDRQIERYGDRVAQTVIGISSALVLVLVMLEVEHFWIGSALFAIGSLGATWGAVAKIRAYRGSFNG